jgi:hypothetical protein
MRIVAEAAGVNEALLYRIVGIGSRSETQEFRKWSALT